MKLAIKGITLLTAAALSFAVTSAFAVGTESVLGFAGTETVSPNGAPKARPAPGIEVTAIVYENTTSPALYAVSSTDPSATWGDRLLTTGTGVLSNHQFSLFNSGSSAGTLLTATVAIDFFDGVTSVALGGYTVNVNFGTGLNPGFFTIVNVTNLDPFAINLNVADVIVTQRVTARTGPATRLGIVSFDPPTMGTSPTSMYISATTIGGGVPGFYTFANGPANPGHQVTVTVPTVGTESKTWGVVKGLFR